MPFFLITRTISLLPVHKPKAETPSALIQHVFRKYHLQKQTSIDVRKQDEGLLVKGEQSIEHQAVDLNGMLDVCGDGVLQSHDVVVVLDLITCTVKSKRRFILSSELKPLCILASF